MQNARDAVTRQEGAVLDGAARMDAFNNHVATSPFEATLAGIRDQEKAPAIDPLAKGAVGIDEFAGFDPLATATVEPTVTAAVAPAAAPAPAARPEAVKPPSLALTDSNAASRGGRNAVLASRRYRGRGEIRRSRKVSLKISTPAIRHRKMP